MAQEYDIIIKGGHVLDAKNNINQVLDVAIKDGTIAKVESNIAANKANKVIQAKGLFVCPGLIDIHSHNFHGTEPDAYLSNSFIRPWPRMDFPFEVG